MKVGFLTKLLGARRQWNTIFSVLGGGLYKLPTWDSPNRNKGKRSSLSNQQKLRELTVSRAITTKTRQHEETLSSAAHGGRRAGGLQRGGLPSAAPVSSLHAGWGREVAGGADCCGGWRSGSGKGTNGQD